jgi:hypothetical protein
MPRPATNPRPEIALNPEPKRLSFLLPLGLMVAVLASFLLANDAEGATGPDLPDPLQRGSFAVERTDPLKLGLATFQEPNSSGGSRSRSTRPGAPSTVARTVVLIER